MEMLSEKPYPKITQAIRDDDLGELKNLFSQYPEMVHQPVIAFGNWLNYASAHGTIETVAYLADFGFDVNAVEPKNNCRALHFASCVNNHEIAKYLISRGSELDVSGPECNPLFGAIIGRSTEIVALVLNNNIDAKAKYTNESMENMDAMAFAMERGEIELARMIADHLSSGNELETERLIAEADRIAQDNDRWSPNNRFNPS